MKLLVVGGAGYVGKIIDSTLKKEFDCRYFDINPVHGAEDRTILASVDDEKAVQQAVCGIDSIVYLAMGYPDTINLSFDVNVRGLYRFLYYGLGSGVKRFIYASTLSVYKNCLAGNPLDETRPADAWAPYGLSKRVGEFICQSAAQEHPSATILSLRLILPKNEQDWPYYCESRKKPKKIFALGPNDTRRLFLAAVHFDRAGFYLMQASGDIEGQSLPNRVAHELLGWLPENE